MLNEIRFNKTANSNLQNEINISIIYHYLRDAKISYRAEISKELNLSAPAVSRAVETLLKQGYIIETEKRKTPSGKKASLLMPNTEKGHVIGIDLLKKHVRIGLFNYLGDMIESHSGRNLSESSDIITDLTDEIDTFLSSIASETFSSSELTRHLDAICVGVPAVVNPQTGDLVNAVLFSNLQHINLKTVLADRYHIPVIIENDVNLSALGERNFGEGKSYNYLGFIEVSSGIGTGIVLDGKLFRGAHNYSGELGYTVIGTKGIGVKYQTKGYLEQHASVDSIADRAKEAVTQGEDTLLRSLCKGDINQLTPDMVCNAALQHDQTAAEILSQISQMLSVAAINLILTIDPEIVILGGSICSLPGIHELLLQPIQDAVQRSLPFKSPKIVLSSLGENAAIYGASFLAAEYLILGKYPYRI